MSAPAVLPLPTHLAELLRSGPLATDNLCLWLDRFLPRNPADFWSLTAEQRQQALGRFAGSWRSRSAGEVLNRRAALFAAAGQGVLHRRVTVKLSGRLLQGSNTGSATELGLTLDPVHGVPRLQGSALKGLARAVAEQEGWPADEVERAFGSGPPEPDEEGTARAGAVEFVDALPVDGRFELVLDGLTPHLGPWYRGEAEAPVEWFSPVPVSFLAVSRASFTLDLLGWPTRAVQEPGRLLDRVKEALVKGLEDLGLGGKTAVGYGYFEEQR